MSTNTYENVMPNEVAEKMKEGSVNILDVREMMEWYSGHIPDAKHLPLGEIPTRHHELDKDQEWIVVCHSGGRSRLACEWLMELGFKVKNMMGGMSSWPGHIAQD